MKILAVADVEARRFYDFYQPGCLKGYDLILACGDLERGYLEFLQTMSNVPVLYVHGNHDERFKDSPPDGCICIDDKIYVYRGVRFLGLGGSHKYRDGTYMYTERQMAGRVRRLWLSLKRHRGFDVLVTHAPARGINDFDNMSHRGFECFVELLERYRPAFFVHGHIHTCYGVHIPRRTEREGTTIINACEYFEFDYPEERIPEKYRK